MSQEHVTQAIKEAFGEANYSKSVQEQVKRNVDKMKKDGVQLDDLELQLAAARETYGVGMFNPNVERQIRARVHALQKSGDTPAPGSGKSGPVDPARTSAASAAPNANPQGQGKDVPQTPVANPTDPNVRVDAQGHPTRNLKENTEGDVNAQQKAQFEKNPNAAVHGGTNNPGTTGGAISDVAAATNSGNTGSGGAGAGNV
jgi:hypothetical protein